MREFIATFEQNGQQIKADGNVFKVSDYEGLEASNYDFITITTPTIAGESVLQQRVLPRFIMFAISCDASLRDFVVRFFKPSQKGLLTVKYNHVERQINYYVEKFHIETKNIYRDLMRFVIRLRCPEPYFESVKDFGYDITSITKLETFPFTWGKVDTNANTQPIKYMVDYREFDTNLYVDNDGDVPIGLRIEIFTFAEVKNPYIILNNSQTFKISVDMQQNDNIIINTIPRQKKVLLTNHNTELNIIHKVNRDSRFLMLDIGKNHIYYGADEGLTNMSLKLFFRSQYLGI